MPDHPTYRSQVLDHLGLVAGMCDALGTVLLTAGGWASLLYRIRAEERLLAQDAWHTHPATYGARGGQMRVVEQAVCLAYTLSQRGRRTGRLLARWWHKPSASALARASTATSSRSGGGLHRVGRTLTLCDPMRGRTG